MPEQNENVEAVDALTKRSLDRLAGAEIEFTALSVVSLLESGQAGAEPSLIKIAGKTLLYRLPCSGCIGGHSSNVIELRGSN